MRSLTPRLAGLLVFCFALPAAGQVLRVADLTTRQIQALDRASTVVMLPGGILEEHGPYLPAFTDGILSARLTEDVAAAIVRSRPGWHVLIFPEIPLGSSGSNELGGRFSFPGTYAVRPSTLRTIFMDLASELGDQGFRWIVVVHVHGAPLHNRALDQASDFFHDSYGGRMVHLWGLVPVLAGWGRVLGDLTEGEKTEEGVSLHGGMDETSLMLYLRPDLVAPDYKTAPRVTGASLEESFAVAHGKDWTGYLGSPRQATAELGRRIWASFSAAAVEHTLKILDGADPASFPRYGEYLARQPLYQPWIAGASTRDDEQAVRQKDWLAKQPRP